MGKSDWSKAQVRVCVTTTAVDSIKYSSLRSSSSQICMARVDVTTWHKAFTSRRSAYLLRILCATSRTSKMRRLLWGGVLQGYV